MEKVRANLIIEILGRPAEHIVSSLNLLIDQMSKEQGVSVSGRRVNEPKKIKENDTLFTTFAEVEVEARDVYKIIELIFIYMPSSIEIFDPSEIRLKIDDANMIVNSLAARLHKYDAVAKRLNMERIILERQVEKLGGKSAVEKIEKKKKGKNINTKKIKIKKKKR